MSPGQGALLRPATTALSVAAALALLVGCSSTTEQSNPLQKQLADLCARTDQTDAVEVSNASSLSAALAGARPGQRIYPKPGVYQGPFDATASGTPDAPIALCGGADVELTGRKGGYALHLEGSSWWSIQGIRIHDAQKGVVLDRTTHTSLVSLQIAEIEQEAVHLRTNSSDNTVVGLRIQDTGQTDPEFGEGIYIGSAKSNWCRYTNCSPDASDRNLIEGNTFGPGITAENIDVKEGTTGGTIKDNKLSGAGATDTDSWIDVKGNNWQITGNTGSDTSKDGMQVHVPVPGWGAGNQFSANTMTVNAPGYGVFVDDDAPGTVVSCGNTATGAASGLTNVQCTP